jgi:hypothetical protein
VTPRWREDDFTVGMTLMAPGERLCEVELLKLLGCFLAGLAEAQEHLALGVAGPAFVASRTRREGQ